MTTPNFYQILGLEETATREEIKKKYQQLILQFHPDKDPSADTANHFILISKAWKTLENDELRRQYDANLFQNEMKDWGCIHETVSTCDFDEEDDLLTYPCRCGGKYMIEQTLVTNNLDETIIIECNSCSLCVKMTQKEEPN